MNNSGCTTVPLGVDYRQVECLKEVVDNAVGTEGNFESREKLPEKLCHQQWLFSLSLMQK